MANYVKFRRGTPSEFAQLQHKNADTLYFIYEESDATSELYLGSKLITGSNDASGSIELSDLTDILIDAKLDTDDCLIYDASQSKWINKPIMSTLKEFVGANSTSAGVPGLVPAAEVGKTNLFLSSDGSWKEIKISDEVIDTLSKKANSDDVYTKTETDQKIANAAHLKRVIIKPEDDLDTVIATHGENCIFMIASTSELNNDKYDEYLYVDGSLEKIGSWEVDLADYAKTEEVEEVLKSYVKTEEVEETLKNYATTEEVEASFSEYVKAEDVENALSEYVKEEEGKRLITEEEGQKLSTISNDAEKNIIAQVSNDFSIDDDRTLILNEINQSKVSGLSKFISDTATNIEELAALASSKVDKAEDGSRLINPTEINQLANLTDLIKSVDENKFTVNTEGKLLLNSLAIDEIEGLKAALAGKVDTLENCRLITKEEADKLEALSIDDNGSVGISANVNASKVQELYNVVYNIVTGTGTGTYDGVEKTLLGIQAGAEKNYISSVDNDIFAVSDGKLSMPKFTNILDEKANQTKVDEIETLLNNKIIAYEALHSSLEGRIENVEKQLTWKSIADE